MTSQDLPLDRIRPNPYQARREFTDLEELAEAIRAQGFISRLRVRPDPTDAGYYQLVYGERRLRAAGLADLRLILCDVAAHTDHELIEIGLVENIQRQDLNPLEEARAFQTFIDQLNYSIRTLAERIGKHRSYVEGRLALLRAPDDVKDLVLARPNTIDAARQIASLPDPQDRQDLIAGVASGDLSSQAVRQKVSVRRGRSSDPAADVRPDEDGGRASPPQEQVSRRVRQDVALISSVLSSWEQMLAEKPQHLDLIEDGLTTVLQHAQRVLELLERK